MNSSFTNEQSNLSSMVNSSESPSFNHQFCDYACTAVKPFSDILREEEISLFFTREYEHAAGCISFIEENFQISYFSLPHPSGIAIDDSQIYILSTRTPHLLYRFGIVRPSTGRLYFKPDLLKVLPGCLYGHEMLHRKGRLYINATGTNEILSLSDNLIDTLSPQYKPAFIPAGSGNCMQLNSITFDCDGIGYSTCFSPVHSSFKPWKDSEGPNGKGAIIRHKDDAILIENLTCPHSVRVVDSNLLYCNSGYGELRQANLDGTGEQVICRLPGFTRGLAFSTNYIFVGLSKIQPDKPKYAPGLKPGESICGISVICKKTNNIISTLEWKNGFQIFDVQVASAYKVHNAIFAPSREANGAPAPAYYEMI